MKMQHKNNRKILFSIILLILLIGGQNVFGKTERPFWVDGYHYDAKNSYIEVVTATGWEISDVRNTAYNEIIRRRGIATGADTRISMSSDKSISVVSNHNLIVKARVIDEYVEKLSSGKYKVYLLVQTAKNPTYSYEHITISDKYPFSARVFVPGMAQIYKGSGVKGGLIIGGEALGIAGIIASFSLKQSYENLMLEDPKFRTTYSDMADTWKNVGYGAIAFTTALYIYNLIDGAVAPGEKRVFIDNQIAVAPTFNSQNNEVGLAMQIKF